MKIDFYIPESQRIPTQLRVKVDNAIDVYYDFLQDAFGVKFRFFKHQGVTLEMATEITNEIVHQMCWQSYDHGARWKERGVREIEEDEYGLISIKVFFRKRDAT
jgi:hypothetical protein